MKKLLLNFAHFIIKKYGIVPLEMKDKVLFNGKIFEIQEFRLLQDYFKTDLEIKMCDCFKFID